MACKSGRESDENVKQPKKGYPNMPKTWSEPLVDYVMGSHATEKPRRFLMEHMIEHKIEGLM